MSGGDREGGGGVQKAAKGLDGCVLVCVERGVRTPTAVRRCHI